MEDVDLILSILENSMNSIGGFCFRTNFVVEHQTLAGLGYCFSASLPPMLAAGAMKSLEILQNNPDLTSDLAKKCEFLHKCFKNLHGLELYGDELSPVKHLRLVNSQNIERSEQKIKLQLLVDKVRGQLLIYLNMTMPT